MAEIYNLGIGLTVVDNASKPVQSVDAALIALAKSSGSAGRAAGAMGGNLDRLTSNMLAARNAAREFDTILTGNSLDDSLLETAGAGRELANVNDMLIEQLGAQGNRAAYAADRYDKFADKQEEAKSAGEEAARDLGIAFTQLQQSMGLLGKDAEKLPGHMTRMRDAAGRFTKVKLDGSLDGIAGSTANLLQKTRDLYDGYKRGSGLGMLAGELDKIGGSISGAADGLASLQWLGQTAQESFIDFEDSTHKLALGLGGTREDAYQLRSEMLDLGLATQYSLGEVSKLTGELAEAGVDLRNVAKDEQAAFVALNTTWGVSGQDIAAMSSTMQAFGGDMISTLDDATAFQRSFGLPGVFQELPGIISGAEASVIQFGDAVSSSVPQIVRNVTHTAGVFAKTYGKTMRESVQAAQKDFGMFAQASRTHGDVFLGLADDFDPMQKALMEVGVPLMDTAQLMRDSQESPLAFAGSMRELVGSLGEFQGARLTRQLQMAGLSDELMGMVTNTNRYEDALRSQAEAERKAEEDKRTGVATFKNLTAGMLDTVKETKDMWENVKMLGKAFLAQTGLTEALIKMFSQAKDVLADFSVKIKEFVQSDRMREWGKKLAPILGNLGTVFLLMGGAAGIALGAIAKVFGVFSKLRSVGKVAKGVGKSLAGMVPGAGKLGGVLGGLGKRFFKLIPGIGQIYAAFTGVSAAFTDMGAVLGDPSASGMEKLQALLRGTTKGVFAAFDALLLGIPGWLTDKFFPDLERNFDKGFANLFSSIGNIDIGGALLAMWDKAEARLGEKLAGARDWIVSRLPAWKEMLFEWGKGIGGAIGGLVGLLWDAFVWHFWNLSPAGIIISTVTGLFEDGFGGAIEKFKSSFLGGLLSRIWPHVWDSLKFAFWDMNPIGILYKLIRGWWEGGFTGALDAVMTGESKLFDTLWSVMGGAAKLIRSALSGIAEGFLGAFGTSLDELSLSWQIIWLKIKGVTAGVLGGIAIGAQRTFTALATFGIEAATGILNSFIGIKNTALFLWDAISAGGKGAFAAVKIALWQLVDGIQSSLIGEGGVLSKLMGGLGALFEAAYAMTGSETALSGLMAIRSFTDGAAQSSADLTAQIAASNAEIAAASGLTDRWNEAQARTKEEQAAVADGLGEITNRIKTQGQAVEEFWAADEKARTREQTELERQLDTTAEAGDKRLANETAARKFRQLGLTQLDAALATLAKKGAELKFDPVGMQAAERHVRDYMDDSLKTITSKVAKGKMTAEEAERRLVAAEAKAVKDALVIAEKAQAGDTRDAGDVADKAKGEKKTADAAKMADMLGEFAKTIGKQRKQLVEIKFKPGAGDALDRHLQKASAESRREL